MWANNSYFFFRYSFDVFTSVCSSHMVCLARILCTASLVIWTPIISMSTKIHTGPMSFYNAAKRGFFFCFRLRWHLPWWSTNIFSAGMRWLQLIQWVCFIVYSLHRRTRHLERVPWVFMIGLVSVFIDCSVWFSPLTLAFLADIEVVAPPARPCQFRYFSSFSIFLFPGRPEYVASVNRFQMQLRRTLG